MLPPDPFGDTPTEPLSVYERTEKEADRDEITRFRLALEPLGIRGVSVDCRTCDVIHYRDWDILIAAIDDALHGMPTAALEPSFNPDPDVYVTWDYCYGYVDGYADGSR